MTLQSVLPLIVACVVAMCMTVAFVSLTALCGLLLRIDFDEVSLGFGPALWSRTTPKLTIRVNAFVFLSAAVRFVGMAEGVDGARQVPLEGTKSFRMCSLPVRWLVVLAPWLVILFATVTVLGASTTLHRFSACYVGLWRGALAPLTFGCDVFAAYSELAASHPLEAAASLLVALVALNLQPLPAFALGRAIMELTNRRTAPTWALSLAGLLSLALIICWVVALAAYVNSAST